jgi:hypothetical protein
MPLHVGWHLAIWVFSIGITRERCLKPHGPDLPWGGGWRGAYAPVWSYGEALALAGSHSCITVPSHRPLASL